jgi:uncharacterized membrane protein
MKIFTPLRIAVLVLLGMLALRPTWTRPDPNTQRPWAVLVDVSPSMRVKDPQERFAAARDAALALAGRLSNAVLFVFSDSVERVTNKQLESTELRGRKSDFSLALKDVFDQQTYQGAVVFTDGRHTAGSDAVSAAAAINRPLLLVGVGNAALFKDAAVRRVQAAPFAFKNTPVTITAMVSANGFSGQQLKVSLKEQGRVLAVETVDCRSNEQESEVGFTWTPTTLGTKRLSVEITPHPDEITLKNNKKEISLDVGRDRFRVLFISGDPGPEYGFLRHQFKSDPGVELVTFVILRNNTNTLSVPDAELSLIPFPTEDVFIQQMSTFDLIVFDEFSYRRFGLNPSLMQAIGRRVEQGGSFLLMGSPAMFQATSDYAPPSIAAFLPVSMGSAGLRISVEPLRFIPKAPRHPIFQIDRSEDRNAAIWPHAPSLVEPVLGLQAKPEATVLGVVKAGAQEHPVLVAWKVKQGRVAVMGTRTTFRWAMLSGGKDYEARLYSQFWKNMVLWLTHSSDDKAVRLGIDDKVWEWGRTATLRVWVFDSYFKPLSDAQVRLVVTWPDKTTDALTTYLETDGVYAATVEGKMAGPASVRAWVNRGGRAYGDDSLSVQITESDAEEADLRPNFNLLKEMAQASNGRFVHLSNFSPDAMAQFQTESEKKFGLKIALWNSPWVLVFIIFLILAEWSLRKWRGLP